MKFLLTSVLCILLLGMAPSVQAQASCDPLPRGAGFCAAGGLWVPAPEQSSGDVVTYFGPAMVLHISAFDIATDLNIRQDELRQMLNTSNDETHTAQTGEGIRYWIEDELYVDDTLANRTVYITNYANGPAVYAETLVLLNGYYVVIMTIEAGTEFTEAHIAAHEDALGRIALY